MAKRRRDAIGHPSAETQIEWWAIVGSWSDLDRIQLLVRVRPAPPASRPQSRVHRASKRRGCIAARGVRTVTGDAGDRRVSGECCLITLPIVCESFRDGLREMGYVESRNGRRYSQRFK